MCSPFDLFLQDRSLNAGWQLWEAAPAVECLQCFSAESRAGARSHRGI
jgi:hypothetical protein